MTIRREEGRIYTKEKLNFYHSSTFDIVREMSFQHCMLLKVEVYNKGEMLELVELVERRGKLGI